ncbi:MAG: precorrin-6y C5,15-methyltransferase (decarboxylating) subunit CbiE, partial [Oscillospiraceae bacterium]|nr:precorrin-6y C5,15-methyltransferase (decarboxylating) subunit CbiE [Oscillospiraceae bacterium]
MSSKKVKIIGIGMNGRATLTEYAKKMIESADILIGAERILKCFEYLKKPVLSTYNSIEISKFLHTENFKTAAVLMSGDCGFFSGSAKLLPEIFDMDYEVVCGISSAVYFCSKIGMSWQDMKFISLHGKESNIVRHVSENEKTFFLLGGKITAAQVCRRLCEYTMNDTEVYIGENLGYENEKILHGTPEDF